MLPLVNAVYFTTLPKAWALHAPCSITTLPSTTPSPLLHQPRFPRRRTAACWSRPRCSPSWGAYRSSGRRRRGSEGGAATLVHVLPCTESADAQSVCVGAGNDSLGLLETLTCCAQTLQTQRTSSRERRGIRAAWAELGVSLEGANIDMQQMQRHQQVQARPGGKLYR